MKKIVTENVDQRDFETTSVNSEPSTQNVESVADFPTSNEENDVVPSKAYFEHTSNDQNEISNIGKSLIITEEQIRRLLNVFTHSPGHFEILTKVINNGEYWFEFDNAKEDYDFNNRDEDFKKEYENLKNSCKEDEIVVYQYTPYTLQEMLETTKEKIEIDIQENEESMSEPGIDSELFNLYLLKDIISQNINI